MFHVKHFGTIGKPEWSENLGRKTVGALQNESNPVGRFVL